MIVISCDFLTINGNCLISGNHFSLPALDSEPCSLYHERTSPKGQDMTSLSRFADRYSLASPDFVSNLMLFPIMATHRRSPSPISPWRTALPTAAWRSGNPETAIGASSSTIKPAPLVSSPTERACPEGGRTASPPPRWSSIPGRAKRSPSSAANMTCSSKFVRKLF